MTDPFIRNLPADLHARLEALAKIHGRSFAEEVIAMLKRGLTLIPRPALPPLIVPAKRDSVTMEDLVRWANEDTEPEGNPPTLHPNPA